VVTRFEEGFKERKEEYKAKTSRQKYLKNEDYKEFKEAIFASLSSFTPSSRFLLNPFHSKLITKMRPCLR
jgi:hypothetical protein